MTIATLIITAVIFKATGNDGQAGMIGTLSVGAVICIIAALAGDMSQDLKTGYLVGATPKLQQYGELIGSVAAAFAIGGVMVLLNNAWGFGSSELPAPQATLMRLVIEGVMGRQSALGIGAYRGGHRHCRGIIRPAGIAHSNRPVSAAAL